MFDSIIDSCLFLVIYGLLPLFFQYFVEAGAIAVRRVRKEDMRHVAKATGATLVCQCVVVYNDDIFFFFFCMDSYNE